MPYLLPSDLLARFGADELAQIADFSVPRVVTGGLLQAAVNGADMSPWSASDIEAVTAVLAALTRAIDDAQSEIDSYLSSRYSVPMATPSAVIKRLTGDIARYCLCGDIATETVQKRYDAAVAFLRNVAAGKAALGIEAETPAPTGGIVEISTSAKVFGRSDRGL